MNLFFTTGQVAKELKTSDRTIRNLCNSGQIKASRSPGGHYRITPEELERLKNLDLLPPVPHATLVVATSNGTRQAKHELLAPPSVDVVDAAEDAFVSDRELVRDTNQLQRLKIRKESQDILDYFQDREQRQQARELEESRREGEAAERRSQQRQAAEDARARGRFESEWLGYALRMKPWNAPADYSLIVQPEVLEALGKLDPGEDDSVVRSMIDGVIERGLRPSREEQAKRRAVESALSDLPFRMRYDDTWGPRARQLAEESVDGTRDGATASQMAAAAKLALDPLRAEYEHTQRVKQAAGFVFLRDGSSEDDADGRQAVEDALAALPIGADDRTIERTKQAALAPIRERIATRLRQEQEAEQRNVAKRRLMDIARSEVSSYARQMLKEFEYEPGESALGIELRCKSEVEKALLKELDGTETEDDVRDRVAELMEELEGCE